MLSRLAAPVANFLGTRTPRPSPSAEKSVPDLLAELAKVRAEKAALERREEEIIAAARARLVQERQALEELKKQVSDCGIEVSEDRVVVPTQAEPTAN